MGRSFDLGPRTAFWAEEKIFRLGYQDWKARAREARAKGDAPLGLIRREGGALQGGALAMCCLVASWRGMGAPRCVQGGERRGAGKYLAWLEKPTLEVHGMAWPGSTI